MKFNKIPKVETPLLRTQKEKRKYGDIGTVYQTRMHREPVVAEREIKDRITLEEIENLREIAGNYDHDLPEVLMKSGLINSNIEYCNESLALLMVLSQAYIGSYPQYATRYWSIFTDTTGRTTGDINIPLIKAVHQAIGGQLVELLNSGITQL